MSMVSNADRGKSFIEVKAVCIYKCTGKEKEMA